MTTNDFVYTSYIKTTPEKVWQAITNPEFTRQYWGGENKSDWKKGSQWHHTSIDEARNFKIAGDVLESTPPKRLVLTWPEHAEEKDKAKHSHVTFEIDAIEDLVCLKVIHSNLPSADFANRISGGWPRVLSSMKSLLETGKALNTFAGHASCANPAHKEAAA